MLREGVCTEEYVCTEVGLNCGCNLRTSLCLAVMAECRALLVSKILILLGSWRLLRPLAPHIPIGLSLGWNASPQLGMCRGDKGWTSFQNSERNLNMPASPACQNSMGFVQKGKSAAGIFRYALTAVNQSQ